METPKMGGRSHLRILLKGDDDLTNSLLSLAEGGQKIQQGLRQLVREKYQESFKIDILQEKGERSDILVQKITQVPIPETLRSFGLDIGNGFLSLDESQIDIIVFSILPEIKQIVYQHRESGYLIAPPEDWEQQWTEDKKDNFRQNFELAFPLTAQQSQENFRQIIKYVKDKIGAYIIFFNACTIDGNDHTCNYYEKPETLPIKLTKLNLALLKLSLEWGISLIDVDQQLAELGVNQHLIKALEYTSAANQAICQEFLRVMADVGFFENRPLLAQVGKRRK